MPAKRELTMRQMRQVLRLRASGMSAREIGRTVGVARSTVQDGLRRAQAKGLTWPLPETLTDAVLEERLFARSGSLQGQRRRAEPDWAHLARELKRPGVTLMILWEEYRAALPDGYGYSRFCDLFREFERRLSPVMRQQHNAGEKVFVDYSGKRLPITDPLTGEVRLAEIFVGVLGASSFTFAEATWSQQLPDFIGSHVRMFKAFCGAPRLIVPDNLKSAVNKASFFDPEINRSYGMMASHYEAGILPTRARKPRDKAKVEAGVRIAQGYILGRMRNRIFFSLAEANAAIADAIGMLNAKVMRRIGVSRAHLFETIEGPALCALPTEDYAFAEWKMARVGIDYHVEAHGYFYSVPFGLIGREVDLRITARTIEVFAGGVRVATHERRYRGSAHGTDPAHMPKSHRRYAAYSPERFRSWARHVGPNTEGLILAILSRRRHPEQGFRTCIGVLQKMRGVPVEQAEAAAARALDLNLFAYRDIAALIDKPVSAPAKATTDTPAISHRNLRGKSYFH
jgi:transposase